MTTKMVKDFVFRRSFATVAPVAAALSFWLTTAGAATVGAPSKAVILYPQTTTATKDQPNISGLWKVNEFAFSMLPSDKRRLKTIEGNDPPLQSWAQALYDQRAKDADAGHPYADTAAHCLPNGMPLVMYDAPYVMQIIQSPKQVTILFEENTTFRIIYLDERLPEDPDPSYGGQSVGHFEGDTLVVETNGLVDNTTIDTMGMPHTDKLHITEHIRRLAPDMLQDTLTLDDPGAFTRPWNLLRTYGLWPTPQKLIEYACNQNQRNTPTEDGHLRFGK